MKELKRVPKEVTADSIKKTFETMIPKHPTISANENKGIGRITNINANLDKVKEAIVNSTKTGVEAKDLVGVDFDELGPVWDITSITNEVVDVKEIVKKLNKRLEMHSCNNFANEFPCEGVYLSSMGYVSCCHCDIPCMEGVTTEESDVLNMYLEIKNKEYNDNNSDSTLEECKECGYYMSEDYLKDGDYCHDQCPNNY